MGAGQAVLRTGPLGAAAATLAAFTTARGALPPDRRMARRCRRTTHAPTGRHAWPRRRRRYRPRSGRRRRRGPGRGGCHRPGCRRWRGLRRGRPGRGCHHGLGRRRRHGLRGRLGNRSAGLWLRLLGSRLLGNRLFRCALLCRALGFARCSGLFRLFRFLRLFRFFRLRLRLRFLRHDRPPDRFGSDLVRLKRHAVQAGRDPPHPYPSLTRSADAGDLAFTHYPSTPQASDLRLPNRSTRPCGPPGWPSPPRFA